MKTHNLNVTGKHCSSKPPPSKTPLFHYSDFTVQKHSTSNMRYWYGLLLPEYFVLIFTRRTHAVVVYLRLSEEYLIVYFDTILYQINKWYATIGTPVFVKLLCFM